MDDRLDCRRRHGARMIPPPSIRFARPAKLGGGGTRIVVAFGGRGADDFAGDVGVDPVAQAGFKGFLHAAVFAGVERQDGDASAGVETNREISQEAVEGGEFVVHGDAQRLKDATDGVVALAVRCRPQQGAVDGIGQRGGRGKRAARKDAGQEPGVRFVGILRQQDGKGVGADSFQQRGRGLTAPRVHPHVERSFELDRETAGRIVELHGRYAKIREDQVDSGELFDSEDFGQAGKIAAVRHENFRTKPTGTHPRLGFGQLDGIDVEPDEASAGLQPGQQFTGVTAVAQGAIRGHFTRLRMRAPRESPRP